MEKVLEIYKRPYRQSNPVVCMDESPRQLIKETRSIIPMKPGTEKRIDYEYERCGVCNVFLASEPLVGKRIIEIRLRKTRRDWAEFIKSIADEIYPNVKKITLVMDNLKTHTTGDNWFQISIINPFSGMGNMMFVNENTGYLCGRSYASVYKTTNGGYNWTPQITYPYPGFNSLYFLNSNTGYAGDYNGVIYKTTNGGAVFISNISREISSKYSLFQNYPNPFNPATVISFQLPVAGQVSLIVYDMLGREVATLVNEKLAPGTYTVDWNASEYPSGVYFYKITAGDYSATKKMLLVR